MDFGLDMHAAAMLMGVLGVLFSVIWGLFRSRTTMLLVQLASTLFFVAHWGLQGAGTATIVTAISAAQMAAAIPLGSRPSFRYVYLATVPVIAVSMALTWNGVPSIFAAAGAAILSIARYQVDVKRFRFLMLWVTPFWFTHNFIVGSYPAMASDLLGALVNLAMMIRIAYENRRHSTGGLQPALQGG